MTCMRPSEYQSCNAMPRAEDVHDDERVWLKGRSKRRTLWAIILVLTLIGLTIGSLTNIGSRVVRLLPNNSDKILHGLVHGLLVLGVIEVWKIRTPHGRAFVWAGSVCVGILVELGQEFLTRGRKGDYKDGLAAALGSCSAWLPRDNADTRSADTVNGRVVDRDEEVGTIPV